MIKIGNIRTFKPDGSIVIKVDRTSILGNPFFMKNEEQRDTVCDQYDKYFNKKLFSIHFSDEIDRITELAKTNDITLLCWCYPKRCHAETIKKHIDKILEDYHEQ